MKRRFSFLLALACGLAVAAPDEADKGRPKVTTLSKQDIAEKLDGKKTTATTVEVTLEPGQASAPHRHPGPVFGYVIEGEYEWAIDDQPARRLKAGDTFYEPTGCLHRISRNPGRTRTRVLAVVLHPHDSKQLATPEPKQATPAVEKDVPYADGGDQQRLDLYLPDRKGFTTVVFTYGGGWHTGSRKSVTVIGKKLQSLGYGCALLSHRLGPKDKFPAQAEDVAAGFAWVKKNIAARGGDPKRVVLMGHSSGAHLSLLIATDPKYLARHHLSPGDIAGVVGLSTPVDLEPRPDKKGFGDALMGGRGADVFARDVALMKAASPIQHITRDLPPTLLIVGENDFPMLPGDARAFAAKARGVGRTVDTFVGAGRDHMAVVRSLLEDHSAIQEQVLAFLKKLDKPTK